MKIYERCLLSVCTRNVTKGFAGYHNSPMCYMSLVLSWRHDNIS